MDIEKLLQELTVEEKALLCAGRDFWKTAEIKRLGIDSVMMCDGPHGLRKKIGDGDHLGINDSISTVCFPSACAAAASFDTELMTKIGETLGEECQAENIAMLLGPGVNIKRSPLCGRNFEYYSEDPFLAGQIGAAYVKGLQSKGVAACVKHFAANNQETLRMTSDSVVDERTLHEIYLAPFEEIVKSAKPKSIMCSYNRINGVFASEDKKLLTDILREKWGFEGFVVTDWGAGKNPVEGIKSGLDLIMPGKAASKVQKIITAVNKGELSETELDVTVGRILKFINDACTKKTVGVKKDLEKEYRVAEQAACECAVLLKNEHNTLPLDKNKTAAFIGEFAKKPRYQGGGSSHIHSCKTSNAIDAAKEFKVVYARGYDFRQKITDETLLNEAVETAKKADYAVVFAGLPNAFEAEGADRSSLDIPENQNRLIEEVAAINKNTVVVLYSGSPVVMPWINKVSAVMEMYLAGDGVGEATVKLLYGDANPCGKLPETFPCRLENNPSYLNFPGERGRVEYREGVFVGYRWYDKRKMNVLFPFGHGLSYTSFKYGNLQIDKNTVTDRENLEVTVSVTNTGELAGKEVVQLYVKNPVCRVNRPIRELRAFKKINLEPGETKTIAFILDSKAFAYYEPLISDWFVESGKYTIEVGSSSRDIRQSTEVAVEGTTEIPILFDLNSTIGEILSVKKGQMIMAPLLQKPENEKNEEHLGKGSEKTAENMMLEMPLSALSSFGRATEEQLCKLIYQLNS